MAYDALRSAGIPFTLIRSSDIRNGVLNDFDAIFVPGGWASNKMKSLGNEGADEIRSFVRQGGSYVGFCGGAGLATNDGLGLLDIDRMPSKERVPSFSGRIGLDLSVHQLFSDISEPVFSAWWPSQFIVKEEKIRVLARYGNALPDAFSSDLNAGDVPLSGSWESFEDAYKIRLDPSRLKGEPAVVEGMYGKGRIILSLVHFDTPDDLNGRIVLINLGDYLKIDKADVNSACHSSFSGISDGFFAAAKEIYSYASDLISFGERNFLWFWRTPLLLQWRRGVRGLEYCTLYVMAREILKWLSEANPAIPGIHEDLHKISMEVSGFTAKAKRVLMLERLEMQKRHLTYDKSDDPEIIKVREELFSRSKSYGGKFKEIIDSMDKVLYLLMTHKSQG